MQTLELLICTIDEGIEATPHILLPQRQDVRYLISWQQDRIKAHDIPEVLRKRDDVRVVEMQGRGLAANRNNALAHATGDVLLLSDDDTQYRMEYFDRILQAFATHPEADFICFQGLDLTGAPIRPYPSQPFFYESRPYGVYYCSWEIAFRRSPQVPHFDVRFGLGSDYLSCGEEEIFIHDAYLRGLKILYLPIPIVETDKNTTGTHFLQSPGVQRAKGAVLCYMHGEIGALLRCIKYTLCLKGKVPRLKILRNLIDGIRFIKRTTP